MSTQKGIAKTHGHTVDGVMSREYTSWATMLQRCNNPNNPNYKNYGARGIGVCPRWNVFEVFFADMGARPEGATLERKDNKKGYWPENCRWATRGEQVRNTRRNIKLDGRCLADVAEEAGVPRSTVYQRVRRGISAERAISMEDPRGLYFEYRGERRRLADIARECGIKYVTLRGRVFRGLDIERATTEPVGQWPSQRNGK